MVTCAEEEKVNSTTSVLPGVPPPPFSYWLYWRGLLRFYAHTGAVVLSACGLDAEVYHCEKASRADDEQ